MASRRAQSHTHTASLSLIIYYTRRNAHTGEKTFKKYVVVDSLALNTNRHIFKQKKTYCIFNRKIFRPNDLQKTVKQSQTGNPNIIRPTNLK